MRSEGGGAYIYIYKVIILLICSIPQYENAACQKVKTVIKGYETKVIHITLYNLYNLDGIGLCHHV